jgi:hypothetical protein
VLVRRRVRRLVRHLFRPSVWAVCLTAACSGSDGSAPAMNVGATACDGPALLRINCSGCHDGSPGGDAGDLDLGAPGVVGRLLDKPASGPRCGGAGAVLIDRAGAGLLLAKLGSPPPCGDRMPQGTYPLSSDEIACVAATLAAGVGGAAEQPQSP